MLKNSIRLTESEIKNIIIESVKRVLTEATMKVDNFDMVARMMKYDDDDLFYFIEIIQRKKDNLNMHFSRSGLDNFHNKNYIKTYTVANPQELMNVKNEIVSLCEKYNARAYISINPRSRKRVNDYVNFCKQQGRFKGREFEHGAGQHKEFNDKDFNWETLHPYGLIDMDIADPKAQQKLEDILNRFNLKPVEVYMSPNGGKHYIMPDRYCKYLNFSEFEEYRPDRDANGRKTRRDNDPMVLFKGDAPIILYSNVR